MGVPFDDGSPEVAAALAGTTRWGSFLSDIDAFDAEFFEISRGEAAKMDPQQRLLLEVAWEALEHAGIPATSLRRSQTGVFAGACVERIRVPGVHRSGQVDAWSEYRRRAEHYREPAFVFPGPARARRSTVDTACSSSLVAVHLACQSLRIGEIPIWRLPPA